MPLLLAAAADLSPDPLPLLPALAISVIAAKGLQTPVTFFEISGALDVSSVALSAAIISDRSAESASKIDSFTPLLCSL